MTRAADGDRRAQLLDAAVDWVLEHGLAALTLRPLAAALGTSDRMLVYHFGGREPLVDAVIDAVNARLLATLARPAPATTAEPAAEPAAAPPSAAEPAAPPSPAVLPSAAVLAAWGRLSSPAAAPYLRFLAEVNALGVRHPERFAGPARAVLEPWLAVVAPMLAAPDRPPEQQRALAAAAVAALYALAVDVQLLGDRGIADEAVAAFARLLDD